MKCLNEATLVLKKSKFIAYYYEVSSVLEVKDILELLKKEHKKAKHIPYAFILENTAGKSDDKEPSNTAGLPIYELLKKRECKNRAIFVVRYFGGIKLGAGLLLRSYVLVSKKALEN